MTAAEDLSSRNSPIANNETNVKSNAVSSIITFINKSIQQTYQENKTWRTPKPWYAVVNIGLVDAKDLRPKTENSQINPFVRLKLGNEKGRSRVKQKTLNPYWCEQYDFYLYEDQDTILEISVKSDEIGKEVLIGECAIDMKSYQYETTHHLRLPLSDDSGVLTILITISLVEDTKSPRQCNNQNIPTTNTSITPHKSSSFNYWKTFFNISKIGWLQITIIRAYGLAYVDLVGSSCDPFCVVELENNRIQTQTVHKSLNPEWFKMIDLIIGDIHSVLIISVFAENPNKKSVFLGKIAIPLLKLRRGEITHYQLKDDNLREKKKGFLVITADYAYNPIRAAFKTFKPRNKILMQPEPKLKVSVMKTNIERAQKMIRKLNDTKKEIESMISWKYKMKSISLLILFIVTVLYIQLYMVPMILIVLLLRNLFITNLLENKKDIDALLYVPDEDEDFEAKMAEAGQFGSANIFDEKKDEEKKSFMEKFQAIQEVCLSVQEIMRDYVSFFERVCNLFTWKVPWITSLMFVILIVSIFVLYFIPIRMIILVIGIRRFFVKFFFPHYKTNNEIMDMISRVHCDRELAQYQELPVESSTPNETK